MLEDDDNQRYSKLLSAVQDKVIYLGNVYRYGDMGMDEVEGFVVDDNDPTWSVLARIVTENKTANRLVADRAQRLVMTADLVELTMYTE